MSSSCPDSQPVLTLLTNVDPSSRCVIHSVSIEVAADGLTVRLIDIDMRRPGVQREYSVEIATSELIEFMRTHGTDNQLLDSQGFKFDELR